MMVRIKGWRKAGGLKRDNAGKYEVWLASNSRYDLGIQRVKLRHNYPRRGYYTVILVPPYSRPELLKDYSFNKKDKAMRFLVKWIRGHQRG